MKNQVVKVRREKLKACMICPLCNKLMKEATTVSLCLHTFCRKCIYKKLSDEEADCCPICYTDLGCIPVEKLRPDHNLQDLRTKIFPSKREKINISEVMASNSLPLKRKERSLSSLVVSTPTISIQAGLTGKRSKPAGRKAVSLRGSSFTMKESIKKEEDPIEDLPEGSRSPETLNEIVQKRRQNSLSSEPLHKQISKRDLEADAEPWGGNVDLWKPLNCLVEAANRTKAFKVNSQSSCPVKPEPLNVHDCEIHLPKSKVKESGHISKFEDDKDLTTMIPGPYKRKRLRVLGRKRAAEGLSDLSQAVLDATVSKPSRRNSPIWFSLVAAEDQGGDIRLPQISTCYLRIKDCNLPVSFIHKYLMKKLDLASEAEVEISCQGQPVLPSLQLHNLVDLWLRTAATSKRVAASVGTPAKECVMVLSYSRTVQAS